MKAVRQADNLQKFAEQIMDMEHLPDDYKTQFLDAIETDFFKKSLTENKTPTVTQRDVFANSKNHWHVLLKRVVTGLGRGSENSVDI